MNLHVERYKIAVDIFYNESKAQQWHFSSHFIVHGLIISFLLSQISKFHQNITLIVCVCIVGIILGTAFLLGYYRSSQLCKLRLDYLKYLDKNWPGKEYFGGNVEKYIRCDIVHPYAPDNEIPVKLTVPARVKNAWIRYVIIGVIIGAYIAIWCSTCI